MLVYVILLIYTTSVSWLCVYINKERAYSRVIVQKEDIIHRQVGIIGAMITMIALIYFAGTRGFMADTSAYINQFRNMSSDLADIPDILTSGDKGVLFLASQVVYKHFFSSDYVDFFIALAFFQSFAVAKFFSNYSEHFDFSCYLFIANMTFLWLMNGIRQFAAVSILLLASKFIFNKKWLPYIILVLISYYIHDSAIICIPFFFIVQGKPFNKKVLMAIVVALLIVMFVDQFTNLLDSSLEGTNYTGYTDQFAEDDGTNMITTVLYAIPVAIAFWKRDIIDAIEHPRHIDVLINMSCCTMAISLVGNFTSGILIGRLPIYFSIGSYALLPWLIDNCFIGKDKSFMKLCCYAGYFCYFVYYISFSDYQSSNTAFNMFLHR